MREKVVAATCFIVVTTSKLHPSNVLNSQLSN